MWGLFGIDTALDPETIIDDIRDAWLTAFDDATSGIEFPADHFFTSIEAVPAGGGPAAAFSAIDPPVELGTANSLPAEVAVAVSHEVTTPRGVRPVGRTFLGPLGIDWTADEAHRPSSFLSAQMGDMFVAFHAAVELIGPNPVVVSKFSGGAPRVTPVGLPIVRYSLDDAWDNQRRRGFDPTTRTPYTP